MAMAEGRTQSIVQPIVTGPDAIFLIAILNPSGIETRQKGRKSQQLFVGFLRFVWRWNFAGEFFNQLSFVYVVMSSSRAA